MLFGLWVVTHLTHPEVWKNYLIVSPFLLGPLGMLFLACWIFPAQMITKVYFKVTEGETIITYLWFLRRTIREIPSRMQITGGGTSPVAATLLFADCHARIPFFGTAKGVVETHEEAVAMGMAQTEEIRNLLQLKVETRRYSGGKLDATASTQAPGSSKKRKLVELLATAPPRSVPRELSMPVPKQVVAFGVGIVLICLLVLWWFVPWGAWKDWWLNRSAVQIPGRVMAVSDTSWTEGGGHVSRGWPIFEYDFTFTPMSGQAVNGVSYLDARRRKPNDRIMVEFIPANTTVARIVGTRTTLYSFSFNLVGMLVPVFFIFIFGWVWTARWRVKWLFEYGAAAEARVMAVDLTNSKCLGNWEPIYQITLQPADVADGPPWIMRDWRKDTVKLARERLATGHTVQILYNPSRPKRLILPEAWLDW